MKIYTGVWHLRNGIYVSLQDRMTTVREWKRGEWGGGIDMFGGEDGEWDDHRIEASVYATKINKTRWPRSVVRCMTLARVETLLNERPRRSLLRRCFPSMGCIRMRMTQLVDMGAGLRIWGRMMMWVLLLGSWANLDHRVVFILVAYTHMHRCHFLFRYRNVRCIKSYHTGTFLEQNQNAGSKQVYMQPR